jgi:hypothetical protein
MASVKKRVQCFVSALPSFLAEQEKYKANRKQGVRPKKRN